jgi:YD repeat-containing protein
LVNNWIAAAPSTRGVDPILTKVKTLIGYDGAGRATSVTMPVADGTTSTAQGQKTYVYGSGTTTVKTAGVGRHTAGHRRDPHRDLRCRPAPAHRHVPSGATSSQTWNVRDQLLSSIDPAGRETSYVYDPMGRTLETDGPAAQSCFTGGIGDNADGYTRGANSICSTAAKPRTNYDEGIPGLAATW